MKLYRSPGDPLPPLMVARLEREASRNWDRFYKAHAAGFFKDRHWLATEFPELAPYEGSGDEPPRVFLEVGCGAGNTALPLAEMHPRSTVHACDYAPRAVALTNARAAAAGAAGRVSAFVADVTTAPLLLPANSVDVATLLFVLSACSPATHAAAVRHVAACLTPGGVILFRDYAAGDLAEERLAAKDQKLGERFFARGDGTRCFYFGTAELVALFAAEGCACRRVVVHERDITNRAEETTSALRTRLYTRTDRMEATMDWLHRPFILSHLYN